jgi:hypothetical protein
LLSRFFSITKIKKKKKKKKKLSVRTISSNMHPKQDPAPQFSPKRAYLLLYNAISSLLWLHILLTVLTTKTPASTYTTLEPWTRWTQTLAVAEILHSAAGKSHSPHNQSY